MSEDNDITIISVIWGAISTIAAIISIIEYLQHNHNWAPVVIAVVIVAPIVITYFLHQYKKKEKDEVVIRL